ncbi:MAG TPA: hypothetical protein VM689_25645 [Aliidongia sp.]|nr:hypothetical protein [Aliidongia sp.]
MELDRFDFGAPAVRTGAWVLDASDRIRCLVQLGEAQELVRNLTFRIVFRPLSSQVRNIEIGERLPFA